MIGSERSNEIKLESGVPQGSVLSPTMYTLYTNYLPSAGAGCIDIMYADDVTQIITAPTKSKRMMKIKVEREINRINRYEKKWKIKTSESKFKILPMAQYKTEKIKINNKEIENSEEGKILGVKWQRTGITGHINDRINKTKSQLSKLYRFASLTPKIKTKLIKTLVLPVLEYPPIPLCCASKTQKLRMQRVLNRGLRFIFYNEAQKFSIADMHTITNIKPVNISLHQRASDIWEILENIQDGMYRTLREDITNAHYWFPRSSTIINTPLPEPVYT